MQPAYTDFKQFLKEANAKLSNRQIEDIYNTIYGCVGYVDLADTQPTLGDILSQAVKQKQEVDQTMFDIEMGCAPCTPCAQPPRGFGVKKAAVANAQIINSVPVEATQRDYAIERIKAVGEKHANALRKQFRINDQRPQTAADLIAMIKGDQFTLSTKLLADNADEIARGYYNNEYGIQWGTPPDVTGYNAAKEVLKAAAQKALDKITWNTVDTFEAIVDGFEAWVYTPAS